MYAQQSTLNNMQRVASVLHAGPGAGGLSTEPSRTLASQPSIMQHTAGAAATTAAAAAAAAAQAGYAGSVAESVWPEDLLQVCVAGMGILTCT